MGTERKAITFKSTAENEAWLESEVTRLNAALSPLEVRKSGLLNALVSMARTQQIQLPLNFLQGIPSKPSTPEVPDLTNAARQQGRGGRASRVDGLPGTISPDLAIDAASHGTVYCSREGSASQELPISPQKAVRRRAEKSA